MSQGKPDREPKRWANLLGLATRQKPPIGATAADVVHRENKWRLLRYRPTTQIRAQKPVLLVPSLINRHYVLDLMPGKSFVEYLLAAGFDTYCIDWGTPGDEDRYLDFDEIVDRYLGRALRVTAKTSGAENAHVLGYCMGGLMAAIHASVYSSHFASLVAVAAPVRFDDDGLLSAWSRTKTMDPDALVKGLGNVPWQLMQGSFQLLRPTLNLSKTIHMIDRAWDDEYLDGFLALDTWGNDNVSFPGETWRRYIDELYRGDRFVQGTFALSGKPAQMPGITAPTMAVTFEHDNIVPWQSAKALIDHAGAAHKEWLHLPGGHVGAMVSRAASKTVWPKIAAWFAAHDAAHESQQKTREKPGRRSRTVKVSA
ncbi:MAG: alpha/beta fold hydrolase [Polyangiales bacterium]